MDGARQDDRATDKVRASIYEWAEHKRRTKRFEQKANENPRFYASSAFYHIRGTRRHLRRLLRKRFGVKVRYLGFRSKQYIVSRKRFPYYPPRRPQDYYDYVQFGVMSNLLRFHDALWAEMHSAYIQAHRDGEDPDVAALSALFRLAGSGPWGATPTNRTEPDEFLREISAVTVAGWAGAHISLQSEKRNQRVEAALRENTDGSPEAMFARLVEELVPATLIAWDELQPGEPLRPGSGKTNLVSRAEQLVQKIGSEAAEKQKPSEYMEPRKEYSDGGDHELEAFLLREELRTKLSGQQYEIAELKLQKHTEKEIAAELHITEGAVKKQVSRIREKLRLAAGE
jgi:DNA-binding CsgD family transcriptional regulator